MEQSKIHHNVDVYTAHSKQVTRVSAGLALIALITSAWVFDYERQKDQYNRFILVNFVIITPTVMQYLIETWAFQAL